MKKFISTIALGAVLGLGLTACGANNDNGGATSDSNVEKIQVGMVTDTGGINDRSFNQGTWEGIYRFWEANKDVMVEPQHMLPGSMVTADYVISAEALITAGKELIIMSGFTFQDAVTQLQEEHPETKFVILDGEPTTMGDNTLAIYFAEQEAGFLAGVAAALESETGKVGFIGGAEIPPVQAFGWGFVAGVAYANHAFDLDVKVAAFQFQGGFEDTQAGATLAGGMYDRGIDIIFAAAGNVGNGVISEAMTRAQSGENVFVIGVDSDQFQDGMMTNGESVILTSAIKRVDNAAYDAIEAFSNGEFPGGQIIVKDASTGGVGLPEENPNLSDDTKAKTDDALERIKNGELVIPRSLEALNEWFEEFGYDASDINL